MDGGIGGPVPFFGKRTSGGIFLRHYRRKRAICQSFPRFRSSEAFLYIRHILSEERLATRKQASDDLFSWQALAKTGAVVYNGRVCQGDRLHS